MIRALRLYLAYLIYPELRDDDWQFRETCKHLARVYRNNDELRQRVSMLELNVNQAARLRGKAIPYPECEEK